MGLAALQFPPVRDFIEAVAAAGRWEGDGQGTMGAEKRKEPIVYRETSFSKKGKKRKFWSVQK
jgi:hypothetical protein